ncbi:glycosyltransferase [Azohydromonas aeria]|uniref:glycosyltransferase n=1 Tax=Azohydromonas aeria TaxID=2590212 RepID=UPI0012F9381A|nr:glycosyltransferase [Azohydromonas aeria]
MKRVLMVAFHFPPFSVSSGVQRTLRFVQHLPRCGWEPLVLSASPLAYGAQASEHLTKEIPAATVVRRAFALDSSRHLALFGRYAGITARPDRYMSWYFDAVRVGMRMIREYRPDVIWTTHPIPTAHRIGAALQRRSGLPWVADFRDPMVQDGYPENAAMRGLWQHIERNVIAQASACVFTTPSAARLYRDRYPQAADRMSVLENGFDEESFVAAEQAEGFDAAEPLQPGTPVLLHSGIVYPDLRDPTQLFVALERLQRDGRIRPGDFKLRFRAAIHEDLLRNLGRKHGVEPFIEILPHVPYRAAMQEMLRADGLLILQGSNCNGQVPAKIYEYFRAGRPVVALTDPAGDTAAVLQRVGVQTVARLDDAADIAALLLRVLDGLRGGTPVGGVASSVHEHSRRGRAALLAQLLESLAVTQARPALTGNG